MSGSDGTRGTMRTGAASVLLLLITAACATTPASKQASGSSENLPPMEHGSATDYSQGAPATEGLTARVARLEHDLAQLRIDYSVVRPDMERIVARDGSVEYRVSAIEEALGFTTGSISPSAPIPQGDLPQAKSPPQSPSPSIGTKADTASHSGPETASAPPAPNPAPDPALAPNYGVHLASYRDEVALQEGWRELRAVNPDLLKGLEPQVRLVDTGKDGIYRRLIAGPVTGRAAADRLCTALKAHGTWCQPLPLVAE